MLEALGCEFILHLFDVYLNASSESTTFGLVTDMAGSVPGLVNQHTSTIAGIVYGHTHMDEVRLLYARSGKRIRQRLKERFAQVPGE